MEKEKSLRWYKNKEKSKNKKICIRSWESTLLFKARTDSLEVMKRERNGEGKKDTREKYENKKERNIGTCRLLIECPEYKRERTNFETEVI